MPNVPPFVFFIMVVAIIWVLSAIASAMSKQKDSQRRQRFREQMEQSPTARPQAYRPPALLGQRTRPQPPPPQLNAGYAVRHPEMMQAPQMARPQRPPMRASPIAPPPPQVRRPPQQPRRGQRFAAPPPIPVLEADDEAPRPSLVAPPPPAAKPQAPQTRQTATAPAISRWLKPGTLRQQFILTEIFQPPLAMREERFT
jgi:hypothetical protein